jgi:hypothetical protein
MLKGETAYIKSFRFLALCHHVELALGLGVLSAVSKYKVLKRTRTYLITTAPFLPRWATLPELRCPSVSASNLSLKGGEKKCYRELLGFRERFFFVTRVFGRDKLRLGLDQNVLRSKVDPVVATRLSFRGLSHLEAQDPSQLVVRVLKVPVFYSVVGSARQIRSSHQVLCLDGKEPLRDAVGLFRGRLGRSLYRSCAQGF